MIMIILEIIAIIFLVILLVAMLRDKKKHPQDYEIPQSSKRPRRQSEYRRTGLPWMGGKKIRNE